MSNLTNIDINAAVTKVIEAKCPDVLSKTYNMARNEWDRIKVDLGVAFNKYEENAIEKYSKVKTLLYRSEPQPLMDFFEPPYISAPHKKPIKVEQVGGILDISNFLIIKGTGGIGKSTLMKYILLKEIEEAELIPIFIELKEFNNRDEDFGLLDIVTEKLKNLGCKLERKGLEYALEQGCFLFLLDGFDELHSKKQQLFVESFNGFCDHYINNYYILSSRPLSDFVEFERFTVLKSQKLDKDQAISLIGKLKFDKDIKDKFICDLKKKLYKKHRSFASNPLLLNMMLLTYDNYAEIPEKLHMFYAQAFEVLYSKHDATKAGFRRELLCKLSYDSFVRLFSTFCFITYFDNTYRFSIEEINDYITKSVKQSNIQVDIQRYKEDLINYLCVIYKDGNDYVFTHRSFQEYFAAVFFKELDDSLMSKIALIMIDKDAMRARNDETFKMLYDMTGERFEKNIIVPLLEKIESENNNHSLYDFYFKKIINGVSVDYIDYDENDYDEIDYEEDFILEDLGDIKDIELEDISDIHLDFHISADNQIEETEQSDEMFFDPAQLSKFEEEIAISKASFITECLNENKNDEHIVLASSGGMPDVNISFIERVCLRANRSNTKPDIDNKEVIMYLYKQVSQNKRNTYELSYKDIIEDKELYQLMKKSWIGVRCNRLATLHKVLTEKKDSTQKSLLELLC